MTTIYDFQDGNGPVPAHRHTTGGGWVADTATVEETAYVGPDARVYGDAVVFGNARVYGDAAVYGTARVSDNAVVFGNARVYGTAWVSDNAVVYGTAWVYGNARVYGDARVFSGQSPSKVYALLSGTDYALQGIFATRLGAEEVQGKRTFPTVILEWEVMP